MNFTEFAFNILLTFFPGVICAYMVDMFTIHKERTQFQFLINSFLLGFGSYVMYAGYIYYCSPGELNNIKFIQSVSNGGINVSFIEIIKVCLVSFIIGIIIIICDTHKFHFRLFQGLGITKKFGELDVWGLLMNYPGTSWVTVRDIENNLMYDGWVKAFSDTSQDAEILLRDVRVYKNDTAELLYETGAQYLSLQLGKISIEVRSDR